MKKEWNTISESQYDFYIDNIKKGELKIDYNSLSSKASFNLENSIYEMKRVGFWKSKIEIIDNNKNIILEAKPKAWCANSSIITYNNQEYELIIRNNPLAEYAIINDGKEIIAYGLDTNNGKATIRITSTSDNENYLFDFLLWYLFNPIARENMSDNLTFLLLVNAG